jgi:hypothetical protein
MAVGSVTGIFDFPLSSFSSSITFFSLDASARTVSSNFAQLQDQSSVRSPEEHSMRRPFRFLFMIAY